MVSTKSLHYFFQLRVSLFRYWFADTNECLENTDNCDVNGFCTNTVGSFVCACNIGYRGDGTEGNCTGISQVGIFPHIHQIITHMCLLYFPQT